MGNIVVSALQLLAGQLDVVAQVIGGLFVLLLCGAFWWNRRQRAAKEPGMASWQFISLCFLIALTAVACGAYGLGLKFTAKESDGAPQTPASTPRAAKPRTQPYRLSENAQTIVFRDSAFIPLDPRNSEFQRYQAWLSAGNRPDPAEATLPPVYAARGPS